jgi:lipoprotein-releasing system ATP-binding protein
MSLITLRNINKSYDMPNGGPLEVIKNLSLKISSGELLAITGQSGSGKSTLLHMIGGLDKPSSGEVLFEGADIYALSDSKLDEYRNRHVGFVFQFHYLLDDFNALENVAMPALLAGATLAKSKERAEALLEKVGLKDRMTHHPKELSGGEQQRVSIARALMNKPTMLLADEPTGNLDKANSEVVQGLLFSLKADNIAVVIVTHDQNIAAQCDRAQQMFKA